LLVPPRLFAEEPFGAWLTGAALAGRLAASDESRNAAVCRAPSPLLLLFLVFLPPLVVTAMLLRIGWLRFLRG